MRESMDEWYTVLILVTPYSFPPLVIGGMMLAPIWVPEAATGLPLSFRVTVKTLGLFTLIPIMLSSVMATTSTVATGPLSVLSANSLTHHFKVRLPSLLKEGFIF